MNKIALRDTMLALTEADLAQATAKYQVFLDAAKLDELEPIESDEQSQAENAADLAEAFDDRVHGYTDKITRLREINFGPKDSVEPGAVVQLGNRYLVISVSSAEFTCEGKSFMGISTGAPIYVAIEGKKSGESCTFNGRALKIGEIY